MGGASGADAGQVAPVCEVPPASEFQPNMKVGGGGTSYKESDHFIVFDASKPDAGLNLLEAAHQCFVEEWCWRSPGLSVNSNNGPYYKFNLYAESSLGSAAGLMQYDSGAGLAYLQVLNGSVGDAQVTVHEFGHALTLSEHGWVDQKRTGFWWESVANFVADTFITSSYCDGARRAFGIASGRTIIDLRTVIGNSQWTICMNQNYYQAWPFFAYLTYNPDGYPGLGRMALPSLFRNHKRNNETPLHVLERVASPVKVQTILGRYWARMAYLDIGHPTAQETFLSGRSSLNFNNLTASTAAQTYKPLADRQPRYGGANIIPLTVSGSGEISVQITDLGNGLSDSNFTATLSVRSKDGPVRYVDLPQGAGSATIAANEEASLVIVNTPDSLYLYDPETIGATVSSDPANTGLNYQVQITGATPTNQKGSTR